MSPANKSKNNSVNQVTVTGSSILDIIAERTSNIEHINVNQLRIQQLHRNIATLGRRETILRDSTISIKHHKAGDKIIDELEANWIEKCQQSPLIYWQDLEHLFVQFPNNITKLEFLDMYGENPSKIINPSIGAFIEQEDRSSQQHITRRPIKCEIANVKPNISTDKLCNSLNQLIHDGLKIISLREGKTHGPRNVKTIMFTIGASGLRRILGEMDSSIQYNDPTKKIRTRLNIKINCKPYQCKKCYKFINKEHQCTGEVCANCSMRGHSAKECRSKKRNCGNCKNPGHRSRDSHCPVYQAEIIKELRKMDIPLEYLNNKDKRCILINSLQYY